MAIAAEFVEERHMLLGKDAETPKKEDAKHFSGVLSPRDYRVLTYLIVCALFVRLAFLSHPAVVIFDEVHFGGFARKY